VLLVLGTNNHLHRLENAAELATRALLTYIGQASEQHKLDRSLLAKPKNFHRRTLHWSDRSKPGNPKSTKQAYRAPKLTKLETSATRDNTKHTEMFTQGKTHTATALVRPVRLGRSGMNSTRGSTPPYPTLDLPNRSTDLCKTLGIVGTPYGHSIPKICSTKTCKIERNRRNSTKNASNPRAKKPQNRAPLLTDLGGESKGKEHREFKHTPHRI
jgi:hypothetical protein